MKVFAISCHENGADTCGTDSYFPCDGRWSLSTCIRKAKEYFNKKLVKPFGFKLYSGSISNAKEISNIIVLNGNN